MGASSRRADRRGLHVGHAGRRIPARRAAAGDARLGAALPSPAQRRGFRRDKLRDAVASRGARIGRAVARSSPPPFDDFDDCGRRASRRDHRLRRSPRWRPATSSACDARMQARCPPRRARQHHLHARANASADAFRIADRRRVPCTLPCRPHRLAVVVGTVVALRAGRADRVDRPPRLPAARRRRLVEARASSRATWSACPPARWRSCSRGGSSRRSLGGLVARVDRALARRARRRDRRRAGARRDDREPRDDPASDVVCRRPASPAS